MVSWPGLVWVATAPPPGGLVLDLFGGSGTTLIAAHQSHRRAALVELDPVYAEVILTRFEKLTGIVPELIED